MSKTVYKCRYKSGIGGTKWEADCNFELYNFGL